MRCRLNWSSLPNPIHEGLKTVKDTSYYQNALHVLNYTFGDFYLYDDFIISEIHAGEVVSWDTVGQLLVTDIREIYGSRSKELVYISNRVNKYAVMPSDWIKFKKNDCNIKAYGIVSYNKRAYLNALLEKLFFSARLQFFTSLDSAISWAKEIQHKENVA